MFSVSFTYGYFYTCCSLFGSHHHIPFVSRPYICRAIASYQQLLWKRDSRWRVLGVTRKLNSRENRSTQQTYFSSRSELESFCSMAAVVKPVRWKPRDSWHLFAPWCRKGIRRISGLSTCNGFFCSSGLPKTRWRVAERHRDKQPVTRRVSFVLFEQNWSGILEKALFGKVSLECLPRGQALLLLCSRFPTGASIWVGSEQRHPEIMMSP